MNSDNRNMGEYQHPRRSERDRFLVVLMGLISYGVILIAIVIGTFFLVKKSFEKKDAMVAQEVGTGSSIEIVKGQSDDGSGDEEAEASQEEEPVPEELPSHEAAADTYMTQDGKLDYSHELFKPASRNNNLKWADTVFSRIENVKEPDKAPVNSYSLTRKNVRLTDDSAMDILIYSAVGTGKPEKITTVSHGSGGLEIIDYYFDDDVINYVAQRTAPIDYPIDISSGRVTSRYYFAADTLVRYSYCEDNKATVFNAASLDEYSQGTVDQYLYLESEMINKAYITYNAAASLEAVQHIEGYVLDEYDQPLVDVRIKLYSEGDGSEAAAALTDGDGHYAFDIPKNDEASYYISAAKDEFDETKIYGIKALSGSGDYYVPTPRLTYASDGAEYNAQIVVRDSEDNDIPIADATINLRAGLNAREGDVVANATLDQMGSAIFTIQSGDYTAEVIKDGYENSYFNVVVSMSKQLAVGYAVKDISAGQLKAVFTWDTTPLDLDARAITSGGRIVVKSTKDGTGSLSAETLTLDVSGSDVYRCYLSDLFNCTGGDANSDSMTGSGARATIYGPDGYMTAYDVPVGHLGVVWEAFTVRQGSPIPVNQYYNVIEQESYWTSK
ncbi:MAG: hypothetical protein K5857_07980 [Lachnospiraceae bacterium]|nr:hypothetical protein [Lachnospiraceae bacterium]